MWEACCHEFDLVADAFSAVQGRYYRMGEAQTGAIDGRPYTVWRQQLPDDPSDAANVYELFLVKPFDVSYWLCITRCDLSNTESVSSDIVASFMLRPAGQEGDTELPCGDCHIPWESKRPLGETLGLPEGEVDTSVCGCQFAHLLTCINVHVVTYSKLTYVTIQHAVLLHMSLHM